MGNVVVDSRRLGALTDTQLQRALARFDLGSLRGAAPVPFGLFGQNMFVSSSAGEYVLRGCPHYDWQFPCEQFFATPLHEHTATPVPWPYLLDPTDDIFGWSYVLMPRMPGLQLADPAVRSQLSSQDQLDIAGAMGACLAEAHALHWPCAGMLDLAAGTIVPNGVSHREQVLADIRALTARPGSLTRDDHEWVEELLAANAPALDEPFTPGVVLHDYKEGNATVTRTGDGWTVSGVFDLMECFMGNREQDLARQTAEYAANDLALARTFVQTYLRLRPAGPGLLERLRLYTLHDRLIIWDYVLAHHGAWHVPGETLRAWAGRAIAALDQILRDNDVA
jgi:hygromycin-B 7''-O-kinase